MSEKVTSDDGKILEALGGAMPLANLSKAYVGAWGEIDNVVKNKANPHFGSDYADLSAVLDTVRPIFATHKLALLTAPGEMDADKMTLVWMLIHASGEYINGKMSLPIGQKLTAQAGGSCLTYMRRYLSASIGGIAQVDDDGNGASEAPKGGKRASAKTEAATDAPNYADRKESLIARVKGCETVADLEKLKPELAEFGDQEVVNEYSTHKKALKSAGAK